MSDEGEKTCPLCAEEMDLTDQQLKPCRCGYEVCVWCWHHIMEMAEKDETEGRCPACRTPYDKERIVGMAAKCERMVAEISVEKKYKSQKAKPKTSENRKQLTSVRVIQRNLVYIVGLPLNLADEDLLQRKEYFGQYGKVLKVSISRTSAGTIQQFANNTCSVYITYGKEDEAVRCIQSVHAFILDGRPLRACFGTTKYCHAWLRNVPCTNPDCLYLHEIGSHEDSFTKDEIISAYTRSRVQQITGVTNNMQRRSGNLLPPPADNFCINSSGVTGKPMARSPSDNSTNSARGSPPTSSSGRSGALPPAASWGARASNCSAPAGSLPCSNGPTKQKAETLHGPPLIASTVSGSTHASLPIDIGKKHVSNEDTHGRQIESTLEILDTVKQHAGLNSQTNVSEGSSTPSGAPAVTLATQSTCLQVADNNDGESGIPSNAAHSFDEQPCSPCEDNGGRSIVTGKIQKLCAEMPSIGIGRRPNGECSEVNGPNGLSLDNFISPGSRGLQWHDSEKHQEHSISAPVSNAAIAVDLLTASREVCDVRSDVQAPSITQNVISETEDDFDNQRLRDAIVSQASISSSSPLHILSHLRGSSQPQFDTDRVSDYAVNPLILSKTRDEGLAINVPSTSVASNGFLEHFVNRSAGQRNSLLLNGGQGSHIGRSDRELVNGDSQPTLDMGESNIISNILSLDLDSWDDSLTSPQNLAKLLGETDKQEGPVKMTNSWKGQISNQSRFSFARQEDSRNHMFDIDRSLGNIQPTNNSSFGQGFTESRDPYMDRLGNGFGFAQHNMEPSDHLMGGHSVFSSGKLSGSRSQISAPPGFAAPSRPPPPGFTSHERNDQTFDFLKSGNQLHESSSFLRNPYQASPSGNISPANDIEFIDPAILAVGKGRLPGGVNSSAVDMRQNFHVQAPGYENESRLQLLMQRSLSPHQNVRYTDVRDNFSSPNDTYSFTSRHMEQSQASNMSPFPQLSLQQPRGTVVSNGHWDGWSEVQAANDIGIAELLRNDRLGFNKFYGGYEDSKFRMSNSGDLYNRSFGM